MKTIEDIKRDISNVVTYSDLQYQIDVVDALKNVPDMLTYKEGRELDAHIDTVCSEKFPDVFKTWNDDEGSENNYAQAYACAIEY